MTPYQLWQIEKYGNALPDDEPQETETETELSTSEINYIYEQTTPETC